MPAMPPTPAMPVDLEELCPSHRQPVMDIFNYYVQNSQAAFPDKPLPGPFFDRLLEMTRGYPAVVAKDGSRVVGFAFLHPFHFAGTLRRTAEISYFLMPEASGKGIGTMILNRFVEQAIAQGIDSILATISSLNPESIEFHRKNGFQECGRLCRAGRKGGEDYDIVWMQRML
ncbi:MAG: N-acetyltransferase [Methanosarcinales archaeon]|nr:N-acetyltransferase [Methanosarcinales archaeon]